MLALPRKTQVSEYRDLWHPKTTVCVSKSARLLTQARRSETNRVTHGSNASARRNAQDPGVELLPLVRQIKQRLRAIHISRREALLKPFHALGGGAVGEFLGADGASRLALQSVVADVLGAIDG